MVGGGSSAAEVVWWIRYDVAVIIMAHAMAWMADAMCRVGVSVSIAGTKWRFAGSRTT